MTFVSGYPSALTTVQMTPPCRSLKPQGIVPAFVEATRNGRDLPWLAFKTGEGTFSDQIRRLRISSLYLSAPFRSWIHQILLVNGAMHNTVLKSEGTCPAIL